MKLKYSNSEDYSQDMLKLDMFCKEKKKQKTVESMQATRTVSDVYFL